MKASIKKHIINQYTEIYPGYIIYRGESAINGEHITAVLITKSNNCKTGNIAQIYYFPVSDYVDSQDRIEQKRSVCGSCSLLGSGCYVSPMGTAAVKRSWVAGKYKDITGNKKAITELLQKYIIRNGADGDPLSAPFNLVNTIAEFSSVHLSYTHLWNEPGNETQAGSHMASVETKEQATVAHDLGWKTFRVIPEGGQLMNNEIMCPNEGDKSIQCMTCQLCDGKKANIAVTAHGVSKNKIIFK